MSIHSVAGCGEMTQGDSCGYIGRSDEISFCKRLFRTAQVPFWKQKLKGIMIADNQRQW